MKELSPGQKYVSDRRTDDRRTDKQSDKQLSQDNTYVLIYNNTTQYTFCIPGLGKTNVQLPCENSVGKSELHA